MAEAAMRAQGKRLRAFIPVHLAGRVGHLPEIASVAEKHGAVVIEDACHALGTHSNSNGIKSMTGDCRLSVMATFSFHPVKSITCGEGGMITTNDASLASRMRRDRNHGMVREVEQFKNLSAAVDANGLANPWFYEMAEIGFNYRLSDIHCALGLSQLGKFGWLSERRRRLAGLYDEVLMPLAPVVRPVPNLSGCDPVLHLYIVLVEFEELGTTRAQLMRDLRAKGIGTQVHYIPVHRQPYYRALYGDQLLPGAEAYYSKCLSIPLYPDMSDDDPARVADALANCLGLA
jgi:dTDP-4-amino-4,6-dideoxygalactose transaminase